MNLTRSLKRIGLVPFRIVLPKLDKSYKKDTELTKEEKFKGRLAQHYAS